MALAKLLIFRMFDFAHCGTAASYLCFDCILIYVFIKITNFVLKTMLYDFGYE